MEGRNHSAMSTSNTIFGPWAGLASWEGNSMFGRQEKMQPGTFSLKWMFQILLDKSCERHSLLSCALLLEGQVSQALACCFGHLELTLLCDRNACHLGSSRPAQQSAFSSQLSPTENSMIRTRPTVEPEAIFPIIHRDESILHFLEPN